MARHVQLAITVVQFGSESFLLISFFKVTIFLICQSFEKTWNHASKFHSKNNYCVVNSSKSLEFDNVVHIQKKKSKNDYFVLLFKSVIKN